MNGSLNGSGGDANDSQSGGATFVEAGGSGAEQSAPDAQREAAGDSLSALVSPSFGSTAGGTGPGDIGLVLEQASVIRIGSLSLSTPNLGRAQAAVTGLLASLDGYLASENTQASADGAIRSAALVLKVPTNSFDTAMQRLTQIGDVRSRTSSTKDVTREVADVDSRVASAKAALDRIRLLLNRADSLGTVIRLESVLSNRQSELESLLAQQRSLASQTQLSTIEVNLSVPRPPVEEPKQEEDERGFVAGLSKGWNAFSSMVVGLATAAGALLPFALLLVILGIPALLLLRRLRTSQRQDAPQAG
ncbi:MAG: DUF4349 domain-containing protein [Actinomycetota bacterium]|nr:DUF4349 domain-containing protein [Actinomycetota bacterium]